MTPGRYDIADHVSGTMFTFSPYGPITYMYVDETKIDLTGSRIDIWFRKKDADGRTVKKLSTTSAEIVLTNPAEGEFDIPQLKLSLPAGIYYYDVLLTTSDNKPYVFLNGYVCILTKGSKSQ
jgi:hypothetical protein